MFFVCLLFAPAHSKMNQIHTQSYDERIIYFESNHTISLKWKPSRKLKRKCTMQFLIVMCLLLHLPIKVGSHYTDTVEVSTLVCAEVVLNPGDKIRQLGVPHGSMRPAPAQFGSPGHQPLDGPRPVSALSHQRASTVRLWRGGCFYALLAVVFDSFFFALKVWLLEEVINLYWDQIHENT